MDRRVKKLVLHLDSCKQCIRMRRVTSDEGNYQHFCFGRTLEPRRFTEAELDALRDGSVFIPLWCPLPDADGAE